MAFSVSLPVLFLLLCVRKEAVGGRFFVSSYVEKKLSMAGSDCSAFEAGSGSRLGVLLCAWKNNSV